MVSAEIKRFFPGHHSLKDRENIHSTTFLYYEAHAEMYGRISRLNIGL